MANPKMLNQENFAFTIDGFTCLCMDAPQVSIAQEKIEQKFGSSRFAVKTASTNLPKVELSGLSMTLADAFPLLERVIDQSLSGTAIQTNASLITTDFEMKSIAEETFMNLLISEAKVSGLDASGKEHVKVTFNASAEWLEPADGTNQVVSVPEPEAIRRPMNNMFRVTGLPDAIAREIKKTGELSIKTTISESYTGASPIPRLHMNSMVEYSDMDFTLNMTTEVNKALNELYNQSMRQAQRPLGNITITYCNHDGSALYDFTLMNYTITKIDKGKSSAGSQGAKEGSISVACERITMARA